MGAEAIRVIRNVLGYCRNADPNVGPLVDTLEQDIQNFLKKRRRPGSGSLLKTGGRSRQRKTKGTYAAAAR